MSKTHDSHTYGDHAANLDELFDRWSLAANWAERQPVDSPSAELAWVISEKHWSAYASRRDWALLVMQGEEDDADHDDYLATVEDANGRGGW